ncbi:MAG: zinc ribbon domain-containing protein [candidate division WOR-3 bacterium]
MPFCPACGAENAAKAGFCRECKTRLETTERLVVHPNTDSPHRPPPPPPTVPSTGPSLERLSVWLGLLGIPGIVVGALLMRRQRRVGGRPLAAVVLGSAVMLAVLAGVAGLVSRPDPLNRALTPERVAEFAEAVTARVEELQAEAEQLRERLGPGAETELAPFQRHISQALTLLAEMDSVETEEELDSLRNLVLDELSSARGELGAR